MALSPPTTEPSKSVGADPLDLSHLNSGDRWRETYQVGEQLPDQSMGRCYRAVHVGIAHEVIIRSFRVNDNTRNRTWEALLGIRDGGMVDLIEALEHEGRRVEVTMMPPAMSLKDWGANRKAGLVEIQMVAKALTDTLELMHQKGVVHLGLRPDRIYVESMDNGLKLKVGGLETATMIEQNQLVSAAVHPFYCPPETVGLYQHSPGRGLKAWDWWSIGRILQEMALGRHILGHILERDVSRQTPEILARAEALLAEKDETASRAGGVECMPTMDKELHPLFKGLLSSCRDARWGLFEMRRWLAKETVKERYNLARNERLFVWKDRGFTVPEAAEFFSEAENWHDGIFNLFDSSDSRSLSFFLNEVSALAKTKERLDSFVKMKDGVAFAAYALPLRQHLIACIAWASLSAPPVKVRLLGREFNAESLLEFLKEESLPDGLTYVRAATSRAMLTHIEQVDVQVSRFLMDFEKTASAAMALVKNNSWVKEDNWIEVAKILSLCLEPDASLRRKLESMHQKFACSRIPVLDKVFKKYGPTQAELAVLAFTGLETDRFEYVTHADWNASQYQKLKERGARVADAITWMNMERAMRSGPLVFGHWKVAVVLWPVLMLLLAFTRQWAMIVLLVFIPFALMALGKYLWLRLNKPSLETKIKSGAKWTYLDGSVRCRDEALAVLKVASVPVLADLEKAFKETNDEIARLPLNPPPEKVKRPRRGISAWVITGISWLFAVAAAGGVVKTVIQHPPRISGFAMSVQSSRKASEKPDPKKVEKEGAKGGWKSDIRKNDPEKERTPEEEAAERADYDEALEEMKRAKAEFDKLPKPPPKIHWSFKTNPNPPVARVRSMSEADSSQTASAAEVATLSLSRFDQNSIDAVVAVRVKTDKGVGLMMWDGKAGRLINKTVFEINYVPLARSWVEIAGKPVFYLGTN